jgi:hypothetical protein
MCGPASGPRRRSSSMPPAGRTHQRATCLMTSTSTPYTRARLAWSPCDPRNQHIDQADERLLVRPFVCVPSGTPQTYSAPNLRRSAPSGKPVYSRKLIGQLLNCTAKVNSPVVRPIGIGSRPIFFAPSMKAACRVRLISRSNIGHTGHLALPLYCCPLIVRPSHIIKKFRRTASSAGAQSIVCGLAPCHRDPHGHLPPPCWTRGGRRGYTLPPFEKYGILRFSKGILLPSSRYFPIFPKPCRRTTCREPCKSLLQKYLSMCGAPAHLVAHRTIGRRGAVRP